MMAGVRPFQFMIGSRDAVDARTLTERARWAEGIGCSHICVHDHLGPQHAPIPLLTAVAMATERIRLCPLVFNNDLRHPAVLAQELASLDILSGGRTGRGHRGGLERARVSRGRTLRSIHPGPGSSASPRPSRSCAACSRAAPSATQAGSTRSRELDGQPKPVQQPHPPFLIGGTRERVLRLAAREADIVGLDLRQDGAAILDAFEAGTDVRVGWIRDEAGDRVEQLDLSVLRLIGDITVTEEPLKAAADVARQFSDRTGVPISPQDVLESPYSLIGTVPDLVDKLVRTRQRWGINSFLIGWFDEPRLRDLAPVVERLAQA